MNKIYVLLICAISFLFLGCFESNEVSIKGEDSVNAKRSVEILIPEEQPVLQGKVIMEGDEKDSVSDFHQRKEICIEKGGIITKISEKTVGMFSEQNLKYENERKYTYDNNRRLISKTEKSSKITKLLDINENILEKKNELYKTVMLKYNGEKLEKATEITNTIIGSATIVKVRDFYYNYDNNGRISSRIEKITKNKKEDIISEKKFFYDVTGKISIIEETIYHENGNSLSNKKVTSSFDCTKDGLVNVSKTITGNKTTEESEIFTYNRGKLIKSFINGAEYSISLNCTYEGNTKIDCYMMKALEEIIP